MTRLDEARLAVNLYALFLRWHLDEPCHIEVGEGIAARLEYEKTHVWWTPVAESEESLWILTPFWEVNRCLPWEGWRVWFLPVVRVE